MQIHEDKRFQELIERMETLYIEGCTGEMQPVLEELQTLAEKEQDNIGLAAAYFYRDILSDKDSDSDNYMEYMKRSLKLAKAKDIPYYQMKASNSLGIVYSELSDFYTSLEYYLSAISIAEAHPEFCYAAVVLNNIGNLFVWLEGYAEAVNYFECAYYKSIVENKNDRELIALIILNLIELYSNLEAYDKVKEWQVGGYDMLIEEEREYVEFINIINDARRLANAGQKDEAVEKIHLFIKRSRDAANDIYAFQCCINAMRLGMFLDDFSLCSSIAQRIERLQKKGAGTGFGYHYATASIEYYLKFKEQLQTHSQDCYEEYFRKSQERIAQLGNTYARSLTVKIALEDIKDENKSVHIQNELLQKDAELDIFTNLYNKVSTKKHVSQELKNNVNGKKQALLLVDIDLFKQINDNYGHGFGDQVIVSVAERIEAVAVGGIAGRFGGDEFLILLTKQENVDAIKRETESLLKQAKYCIQMPDERVPAVTLSIGVCVIDNDMEFEEAFARADKALYRAKELGRNRYEMSE